MNVMVDTESRAMVRRMQVAAALYVAKDALRDIELLLNIGPSTERQHYHALRTIAEMASTLADRIEGEPQ